MSQPLLTPEFLSQLESLELRAKTIVDSVLTGSHRGQQKGFSVDFSEHRDYSPGDDVRFLDWKLYARRDRFYVRQFEDENQLQVWIVVDCSRSMLYRSKQTSLSKLEYAATLAAALTWIGCYQGDQSALLGLDREVRQRTGPVFGHGGARRVIGELETTLAMIESESEGQGVVSDRWEGLEKACELIPKQAVVVLLSDGFYELDSLKTSLAILRHKNCDRHFVQIVDPAELDFPFEGNILFRDLEGFGDQAISSSAIRTAYQQEIAAFQRQLRQVTSMTRARCTEIQTSFPLDQAIRTILQ